MIYHYMSDGLIAVAEWIAYIAYQIWLSSNNLIFDGDVIPARRILDIAIYLAQEYCRFDTATPIPDIPNPWSPWLL